MKNAIISVSINFQDAADVTAYKGISPAALPDGEREYNEVTDYKVGYANIVLIGANGRTLAKFPRGAVKGFAIDGEPIVIAGPDFKRIGCGDKDQNDEAHVWDPAVLDTVFAENIDQAIADGMVYRVAWLGTDNQPCHEDFSDSHCASFTASTHKGEGVVLRRLD